MEDMIIKGTGNSRYLKSVANIMTLYPTYESFATALANGTFPIDLNGINPAGVETAGTRLNKASLLTDALCTALGLSTTATPTQAMDKLRQLVNTAQQAATRDARVAVGTYVGTGAAVKSKTLNFPFSPKLVFIFGPHYDNYQQWTFGILKAGLGGSTASFSYGITYSNVSVNGNGITWSYSSSEVGWMLNTAASYSYVVFG